MNNYKKIAIAIIALLSLLVVLNIGLNFWINKQLPKIISDKNETPYAISYTDLSINLLSRTISAEGIAIIPKKRDTVVNEKLGIYSKIKSIEINDFKIWPILFNNKIKASSITINTPQVLLYKKTEKAINNSKSLSSEVFKPFQEIIVVSKIKLLKGNLKIIHTQTSQPILSINNINLEINGIVINETSLNNTIPFMFDDYNISGDSLYYKTNEFYHLTAQNIQTTNKDLKISKFKLTPEYSRREFTNKLSKEKDLFTLQLDLIKITALDWGFKNKKPYFNASKIAIEKLAANIYRNKIPTDDLSKKPLYNKLLRDLKFPLKVDTLAIKNSLLVYEEEIDFTKGPGILTFNEFNLIATNIQSGFEQKKLKDIKIAINCKFMNNSPFKVHWNFNVLDKKDRFNFTGKITNLNTASLARFTKPYINATTKGTFDYLEFKIDGNDYNSYETAALQYHDLKVTLYQKNGSKKKSIIKSVIANLIVKNDTDDKTTTTTVKTERIPEKSFFNFLWLNVAGILKQIVI
ncbi:hypothetical protein HNP99_002503 [Flavobacterium sp. 28A]|uniref:hypothetical protein n=1 Tax=Flavobacterium sp. 28A TaxID=2735895 RepID=UPI001570ADA2|nr:hypothetical protein [Flavobacterium sp. 28A]NRT16141.1 hypothetical protein [Flavobacterium sp. 28A]